jgi:hypothetical protein
MHERMANTKGIHNTSSTLLQIRVSFRKLLHFKHDQQNHFFVEKQDHDNKDLNTENTKRMGKDRASIIAMVLLL